MKMYIGHDVVFNEVQLVTERNCLLEIVTIIWYIVDYRAQNRKKIASFVGLKKGVLGCIVVERTVLQREKLLTFSKE